MGKKSLQSLFGLMLAMIAFASSDARITASEATSNVRNGFVERSSDSELRNATFYLMTDEFFVELSFFALGLKASKPWMEVQCLCLRPSVP